MSSTYIIFLSTASCVYAQCFNNISSFVLLSFTSKKLTYPSCNLQDNFNIFEIYGVLQSYIKIEKKVYKHSYILLLKSNQIL